MLIQQSRCNAHRSLEVTSLPDIDGDLEIVIKTGGRKMGTHLSKNQVVELKDHLIWILENRYND